MLKKMLHAFLVVLALLIAALVFFKYGVIDLNIKGSQGIMKSKLAQIHKLQEDRIKSQGGYECDLGRLKSQIDEVQIYYQLVLANKSYVSPFVIGVSKLSVPENLPQICTSDKYVIYAIKNFDRDPCLDVFSLDQSGEINHLSNDLDCQ